MFIEVIYNYLAYTSECLDIFCWTLPLIQPLTSFNLFINCHSLVIKRPVRDACLCMGELPAPPAPAAPPAPHFVFLITL